ncbi:Mitochondrial ATP synthase g subunit [Popillia japonica]|uniref:Mitochondrial ATP synthase g subunit n=1 Tax=Popillia japonica TaxID=7064 RepID=A0AAW1HG66_POPJA
MAKLVGQSSNLVKQLLTQSQPKFQTFLKYAKVELTPPTPGKWKQTTVREAWLNTLVTIEVLCWFYVGECIGKRHIVGYNV